MIEIEDRGLAAGDHVEETGALDELGHRLDFGDRLRRFEEGHVGAGGECSVHAGDRLLEADDGAGIRARDQQEIRICPGRGGGANLRQIFVERDHRLVVEVAAFLREALVLDVEPGDAALLVLAHGPRHVELVAVAGIGVGDHRDFHRGGEAAGVVRHLAHGEEAVIGVAERRGGAGAGHVHGGKAGLLDGARADAVVSAGRDQQAVLREQPAQSRRRRGNLHSHERSSGYRISPPPAARPAARLGMEHSAGARSCPSLVRGEGVLRLAPRKWNVLPPGEGEARAADPV